MIDCVHVVPENVHNYLEQGGQKGVGEGKEGSKAEFFKRKHCSNENSRGVGIQTQTKKKPMWIFP